MLLAYSPDKRHYAYDGHKISCTETYARCYISDDGIIYVAVKDEDAVTMIDGTTISYLFDRRANGMDDPRDVAVGPATGVTTGEAYQFKIIANDGTEDEWNGYAILIDDGTSP